MRTFLFLLLVAAAVVLLWAIRNQSYDNGLVFSLGLILTALCGYLIADYFFNTEKKTLVNNLMLTQKENEAMKARVDLLQTQYNTATPHTEVEQLNERIRQLEDEKQKLDGITRAQTAEISSLMTRWETLQKSHINLKEEAAVSTETSHAQLMAIQDTLANTKQKLKDLMEENTALRSEMDTLKTKAVEPVTEYDAVETSARAITIDPEIAITGEPEEETNLAETVIDAIIKPSEIDESQIVVLGEPEDRSSFEPQPLPTSSTEIPKEFGTPDNLKIIEGIGPKIETVLKAVGIDSWQKLSMTTPEHLRVVLDAAGKQYRINDPTSWPEQAMYLAHGEFERFKNYKAYITGGETDNSTDS
jgi:predicted flap endonuclease-1-like 5' DNA nuclease